MDVNTVSNRKGFNIAAMLYQWVCRYWLPVGFFLFIAGLFLAPGRQEYKVILNYLLLLPGLFAFFYMKMWWPHAQRNAGLLATLLVYLLYMSLNAWIQNGDEGRKFVQWSAYVIVFVVSVGLSMQISRVWLTRILWLALIAASGAAIYAIGRDWLAGHLVQIGYRLTGYGALYNPLRSGHIFGVMLIIAIWCAAEESMARSQRCAAMICAVVIFVAVLLTGSRSPLIALTVVAALSIVCCSDRTRLPWYAIALVSLVFVVALLFGRELSERGLSLRPEIWKQSLVLLMRHPWFGVGLGNEMLLPVDGAQFSDPHNIFLAAAHYGGVIGLLLFCALFGQGFWRAWARRRESSLFVLAATLQLFGISTLQFDGGSLLGRPTEFWLLYWLPIAIFLRAFNERYSQDGVSKTIDHPR